MTEFDAEPMPNMEEVINRMSGHKFVTKMDCCKGYWQVGLPDNCKHLTAFETPKELFQFKTMPFGLVNSGLRIADKCDRSWPMFPMLTASLTTCGFSLKLGRLI